jgi:hypothetical protein
MEAVMAQTDIHPARAGASAGRKRVRIDWKRGASLLIDGETPTAICAALGIDEDRLWRHLRSSLRFQHLLRQARERRQLLGRLRLEQVSREAAVRLALGAEKSEAALIAQLAATAQGGGDAAPGEDVIARLAQSGRRPPNQALRQRLAAEREKMDAEFAEHCRAVAAHRAAQAPAAAPQTENKTQISGNKTQLSRDQTPVGEDRSRSSGSSVAARADTASSLLPPGLQHGGTVDLTDMHGHPLAENRRPHVSGP